MHVHLFLITIQLFLSIRPPCRTCAWLMTNFPATVFSTVNRYHSLLIVKCNLLKLDMYTKKSFIVKREMTTEWLDRDTEILLFSVSEWLLNVNKICDFMYMCWTLRIYKFICIFRFYRLVIAQVSFGTRFFSKILL